MRKNKTMRLAACLLVMVMLTTSMISGTFAKYTSSAEGSDTARVAEWEIQVNDKRLGVEKETITFDLFDTILDSDIATPETDVKDGKIIAPGTSGHFDIQILNKSEVNAKYTIAFTESKSANVPVQYSLDGTTWVTDITDLDLTNVDIAMETGAVTKTVYWKWDYEGAAVTTQTDATDTGLGFVGTDTVKITATITVTQVD